MESQDGDEPPNEEVSQRQYQPGG